jgi:ketosteroid isomerase-like protein
MKKLFAMALAFSFVLANVNMSFAQQGAVSIERENGEIRKVINDQAQAANDFLRIRDVEGNLRFYAKDYFEIRDGKIETLADMKQNLEYIVEQLRLGRQLVLSVQYSDIYVEVNGNIAWATYDATLKFGTNGTLTTTLKMKCTSIFRRSGSTWLCVHDHSSKEAPSSTPRLDNN